jgi:predicted RNase H-like nuclease (RuvC/YqgF family)
MAKSFLDSVKGALFEEEKPVAATPPPPSIPFTSPVVIGSVVTLPLQVDPEIRARLEKAIEPAAQPALSALRASMKKLEKAVTDPSSRLSAALALLDGASTPQQVLIDIQEALEALQGQEKKALDGAQAARQSQVGGIDTRIASNESRLTALAQEAEQLRAENAKLTGERATIAAKIDATLSAITGTAAQIRSELTTLQQSVEQKGMGNG